MPVSAVQEEGSDMQLIVEQIRAGEANGLAIGEIIPGEPSVEYAQGRPPPARPSRCTMYIS